MIVLQRVLDSVGMRDRIDPEVQQPHRDDIAVLAKNLFHERERIAHQAQGADGSARTRSDARAGGCDAVGWRERRRSDVRSLGGRHRWGTSLDGF